MPLEEVSLKIEDGSTTAAMPFGFNSHGNSDAFAFYNGIDVAYKLAKAKLIDSIKEGFAGE